MRTNERGKRNPDKGNSVGRSVTVYVLTAMLTAPLSVLMVAGPAAADPVFDGHAWIGAQFSGNRVDLYTVEADITVPTMYPNADDFYYVLISIWDSSASYDQIGFSAMGGMWGVTWARLGNCGGNQQSGVDFDAFAYTLTRGLTYHFLMAISDNGDVVYDVSRLGSTVWTTTQHTGGTYFQREATTWCNLVEEHRGYTVYEEIYTVEEQAPPQWGFDFLDNKAGGTTISSWTAFTHTPWPWDPFPSTTNEPDPKALIGSNDDAGDVFIWNEWFRVRSVRPTLRLDEGTTNILIQDAFDLELNPQGTMSTNCESTCAIAFSFVTAPYGWSLSVDPVWATPPAEIDLDLHIPVGEPIGTYEIELWAQRTVDFSTTVRMVVEIVAAKPPTGDHGACLIPATQILTPWGEVDVEDLNPQDTVVAWDFTHQSATEAAWTSTEEILEPYGLSINDDALVIAAWGQRIWARTEEGTGWVDDPIDLSVGDLLFNAEAGRWVEVTSVVPMLPFPSLCGLQSDGENNFVANGFLMGGTPP